MVVVPFYGRTTVYVTGAVLHPTVVTLEQGDSMNQVLHSVQLQDDADISAFLRRKKLKNGAVVEIKKKKQQKIKQASGYQTKPSAKNS